MNDYNVETKIKLDRFKPRDYQKSLCDAFENKGYRKLIAIWPRRCLSGQSHITMADGSFKFLKDIKPGDKILSWNGNSFESDTVKHFWSTGLKNTKIVTTCAQSIVCSEDHIFAYKKRPFGLLYWDPLCEISSKALLFCFDGLEPFTVIDGEPEELFDIETEKNHNFIANGFVVHNSGKDIVAFNLMVRAALKKIGVYYYILPTYSQGRKIIFDSISNSGQKFVDFIPPELVEGTNSHEMKIKLINGSLIQVVGSDNVNTLVGTNPMGVIFSEYALQDPTAYQFIRPILAANNGWAIFCSTPRGKNMLWEMFQIASHSPEWFVSKLTLDDTNHIPLGEIEKDRQEGLMSEDLIQQEYYCFPASQEVLTVSELKSIADIKPNELVISHSGRPRKVIGTISREYEGDLIRIISYGSPEPILCTPDHPIRVYEKSSQKYQWKKAKDITTLDRLVFPKMPLGQIPIISYELCMLLAWYICEGSSFKTGLQFTVGKQEEVDRVCYLLTKLGLEFTLYSKETSTNIVVNSCQFVDLFKILCGTMAYDKRIPLSLISAHEDDFFHELMKGDGCFSDTHYQKFVFTTVSKTLAYQVQLLANSLKRNYAAGLTIRKAGVATFPGDKTYMTRESYVVSVFIPRENNREGFLFRTKYAIAARIQNIKSVPYSGLVHNLKVQYDESYLVGGRSVHNCSFTMGVEGSYYAKYLDRMRLAGQIGVVPWEPAFKVNTAWDLGMRDSTTIIFFSVVGATVRIIDCYEKNKEGLEHYAKVIQSKPYQYGKHFAPHDIAVRELGTGMTRIEKAKQLGINFTIAPNIGIEDGIEAVRSSFAKMWIDEVKCAPLIKALENYRQEYDAKKKIYNLRPLHDFSSHFADAMRYLAVSLSKVRDGATPEDIDRRYREARYGGNANLPGIFGDNGQGFY